MVVHRETAEELRRFTGALHSMLERLVELHALDPEIARTVSLPSDMVPDAKLDRLPSNARIHFCRLDLITLEDGDFRLLEVNANCPAALVYSGWASRAWRRMLSGACGLPVALDHEGSAWFAEWFSRVARASTGTWPARVALLRTDGGNRTELAELRGQFEQVGIEAFEADPREIVRNPTGVTIRGRVVRHAYLKLGIQDFRTVRREMEDFVAAVRAGDLFIQNGQRGRWLGDNKLCLAVLSDPAFQDRFAPVDWTVVHPRVPWSRNLARCPAETRERIRARPGSFVLKHPLQTRGRGVLIGREVTHTGAWLRAVDLAEREGWLVQEFCPGTRTTSAIGEAEALHDLAIGLVEGGVVGAFSRSSAGFRTNIARGGRLHPVFL